MTLWTISSLASMILTKTSSKPSCNSPLLFSLSWPIKTWKFSPKCSLPLWQTVSAIKCKQTRKKQP
jgi:hypothetical protein